MARKSIAWIIATRNDHKVNEIRAILGSEFRYLTLRDFPSAPAVNEDAPDFAGNATRKALEIARFVSQQPNACQNEFDAWVMADDSGLEVDELGGAPGVHSARFAAADSKSGNSPDSANNQKLLTLLQKVPLEKRSARFRCVIAITPVIETANESNVCHANEGELRTQLFEGRCEGHIGFAPSGKGGFGYDPLFVPSGHTQSFAELGEDVKNGLSHRAKALAELRKWLRGESG
jgi:XTP/dITP diphosphohydrolase